MRIVHIKIIIAADPEMNDDKGLDNKIVAMEDKLWVLPQYMYPRDVRFLAALQELVDKYNGRMK